MNKTLATLALIGLASAAAAQSWDFELSNPQLGPAPGDDSTTVTLFADVDPSEWLAGANLNLHATETGWSDLAGLIPPTAAPPTGPPPATISGASVLGISGGQVLPILGFTPIPGRLAFWQATFTVTDFTARTIDMSTDTTRFEVWLDITGSGMREPRIVTEGHVGIDVVPAPAALALLGLGGAVASRRGVRRETRI